MDKLDRQLQRTNLNLLPILRAVLKHRNLTRAAEELNLTQSAVSNSLRKLRDHFDDELLVRDGRTLRLTAKASRLVAPLDEALSTITDFLGDAPFDPATSTRTFRIAADECVCTLALPAFATILAQEAPHVRVQIAKVRGTSVQQLQVDNIDMVIVIEHLAKAVLSETDIALEAFQWELLYTDQFVCVGRDDDETLTDGLTLDAYLSRPHVSFYPDFDAPLGPEHRYLLENGFQRFDRLQTSELNLLALIAAGSDCIALVPEHLARLAARAMRLRIVPAPLPLQKLNMVMAWNGHRAKDGELLWLRSVLRRSLEDIRAPLDEA